MKSAVLLLSGGLDSAANLALGPLDPENPFQTKLALTLDYGQRSLKRELEQARALAAHFKIEHMVFPFPGFAGLVRDASGLFAGGGGSVPVPQSLDDAGEATRTAKAVWVPNRNGVLLSLAAAAAESRGLGAVAVGFNAEEAATFPDNTVEYMGAMTDSFAYSTANKVEVVSVTAKLRKPEIVRRLAELRFPFELLWSCYHAGEKHCGACESCQRLKRALKEGLSAPEAALEKLFGGAR